MKVILYKRVPRHKGWVRGREWPGQSPHTIHACAKTEKDNSLLIKEKNEKIKIDF